MPVYEYECTGCGHRFEEWQKISDKPVRVCPKCNARKVERLISQTSFQLKGGGWYGDLYASKRPGNSDSAKPDGEGKPKASAPAEGAAASKSTTSEGDSKAQRGKKAKPVAA
jgi:putative FmdB family regulatory protein